MSESKTAYVSKQDMEFYLAVLAADNLSEVPEALQEYVGPYESESVFDLEFEDGFHATLLIKSDDHHYFLEYEFADECSDEDLDSDSILEHSYFDPEDPFSEGVISFVYKEENHFVNFVITK